MSKPLDEIIAPACTALHLSALKRVANGRGMFGAPARDKATLWENAEVAKQLHEWRLVAGVGDGIYVTNLGRKIINKLEGK